MGRLNAGDAPLRMGDQVVEFVERAIGDAGRLQLLHRFRAGAAAQRRRDDGVELRAVGDAQIVRAEARVGRKAGLAQHPGAQARPFALILDRQDHRLVVGAGEGAVGRDRGVHQADPLRWLGPVARLQIGHVHPVGERMEQRHLNSAPLARAFARVEGLEYGGVGGRAGGDVGDRDADAHGVVRRSVDREQAALALDQQVIGLVIAIGAVLAIAGDGAVNQTRMARSQRLRAQVQALRRAGRQILQEDVRLCGHRLDQSEIFGLLEVKPHRLLAAVQPDEIGAFAFDQVIVRASEIALGAFDLDHPGAGVGQPARRERRGDRLFQRHDEKTVQIGHFNSFGPSESQDSQRSAAVVI